VTPWRIAAALVALAIAVTFLPARRHALEAATPDAKSASARIGLVFDVGGRGDKSFNDAAYIGLMRAQRELGVEVSFLEPAGSEDREAGLRLFAARGLDLVVAVGFIFSSDVDAVAKEYPSVHFACIDYAPPSGGPPPNVAGLVFREEEGSFLVGAAAGLLTQTHHVGFVGGMVTPLIRKFEAGYAAGVEATCPACIVHSAYAGATPDAFKDPAKGKAIAVGEIASGADVLYHASGATGHGVFEAAHDAHVFAIGVDADQYAEMPGTVVTSMVKRMDVTVFDTIRDVVAGRFSSGMHAYGLAEGAVDWVHEGAHADGVPRNVVARVEELRSQIVAGAIHVPVD
jgi:basic membrane protein A and related proteins